MKSHNEFDNREHRQLEAAYHEAGHAVMYWHVDKSSSCIEARNDKAGRVSRATMQALAYTRPCNPSGDLSVRPWALAMVAVAGVVARRMYRGYDLVVIKRMIWRDLNGQFFGDAADLVRCGVFAGASKRRERRRIHRICEDVYVVLKAYWPVVEAIADAVRADGHTLVDHYRYPALAEVDTTGLPCCESDGTWADPVNGFVIGDDPASYGLDGDRWTREVDLEFVDCVATV